MSNASEGAVESMLQPNNKTRHTSSGQLAFRFRLDLKELVLDEVDVRVLNCMS